MRNALASKVSGRSTWLVLLLGGALAALTAQSCSVDSKDKYTFVENFPDGSVDSNAGMSSGGGSAHGGGDAHGGNSNGNAGEGEMSAGTSGDGCTVGEFNCTPDGHLQTCQAGDPPEFDAGSPCGDGKCSASQGGCLKCVPGEFQCASNLLQQCNIFGSAFEDTATCDSKAACVANGQKGYCVRCKAGATSCEGTLVQELSASNSDDDQSSYSNIRMLTCNLDGSGTDSATTCLAESPICDATSKKCLSCQPNGVFCDGLQLNVCSADGMDWTTKANCGQGQVCDATAGKCVAGTGCTVGTYQCSGSTLQSCNAKGTFEDLDYCASSAQCDSNYGRCQKCQSNSYSCVGDTVQACDYNNGNSTPYTAQTCTAGNCVASGSTANCSVCRPNTISCYDGSPSYSACSAANTWLQNTCLKDLDGNQMVCSSALGKCVTCVPGRAMCGQNGVLQVCKPDGSGYTTQNCQDSNQQCDAGLAKCVDAQPGRFYCTADGDLMKVGYDLMKKDHSIVASKVESCGSQNQCNAYEGSCRSKRCVPGQLTCSGADVYSCDTGDHRQRTATRCGSVARCQDGYGCVKALAVAAGDAHTCAIVAGADAVDGSPGYAMCWGANESGQLGDGSPLLSDSKEPRQVLIGPPNSPGGNSSVPRLANYFTGICAGKNFTCAELSVPDAGTSSFVACWGSNEKGQLGAALSDAGPFNGPFTGVTDMTGSDKGLDLHGVTCGAEFACALGPDGAAWCWGANESGQLGIGAAGDPANMPAVIAGTAFTQITAGARHVCGVKADSAVWCWGANDAGQLGSGAKKGLSVPTLVGKVAAAADRPLALGNDFTLALSTKASKNPFAWGSNTFGQLANATNVDGLAPGPLAGLLTADFLASGTLYSGSTAEHACARIGDRLFCWGANVFGEVGDGSTVDRASPVSLFDGKTDTTKLAPGAHSVAVGGRHSCAITAKGDVMCWGANHRYQLGSAAVTPQRVPLKAY
jgi:alpha-tubulin suppressor-like RCC1 family protein